MILKNIRLLFCILALMITLPVCSEGESSPEGPQQVFKLVNSWGVGGWERVPDGCLYMTYDAMKSASVPVYVMIPRAGHVPLARAFFRVTHPRRGNVHVSISDGAGEKRKEFLGGTIQGGGDIPFPSEELSVDITDLMPFENTTLRLRVEDYSGAKGMLNGFRVVVYDAQGSSIAEYRSADVNIPFGQAESSVSGVTDATASNLNLLISQSRISSLSRPLNEGDLLLHSDHRNDSVSESKSPVYGRGFKVPSAEEWSRIIAGGNVRYLDSAKFRPGMIVSSIPERVDFSASPNFPPIGNQGSKGSCTAWAMGYYINGFYQARERGWLIRNVEWIYDEYHWSGFPDVEYQNRVLSPDFVYHLVNGGYDGGSWFEDISSVITRIGQCTWAEMPYDMLDYSRWGNASAWISAARYRAARNDADYFFYVTSDEDVNLLKELLAAGYLVGVGIDANRYTAMSGDDILTRSSYGSAVELNHANVIVGYDDAFLPE